jgi:hypothetical protein
MPDESSALTRATGTCRDGHDISALSHSLICHRCPCCLSGDVPCSVQGLLSANHVEHGQAGRTIGDSATWWIYCSRCTSPFLVLIFITRPHIFCFSPHLQIRRGVSRSRSGVSHRPYFPQTPCPSVLSSVQGLVLTPDCCILLPFFASHGRNVSMCSIPRFTEC